MKLEPNERLSQQEIDEANDTKVGEGTPESAPWRPPTVSAWERLRLRLPW